MKLFLIMLLTHCTLFVNYKAVRFLVFSPTLFFMPFTKWSPWILQEQIVLACTPFFFLLFMAFIMISKCDHCPPKLHIYLFWFKNNNQAELLNTFWVIYVTMLFVLSEVLLADILISLACQCESLLLSCRGSSCRLGRLQDSNAVLSHFNEYSERCFAEVSGDLSRNTRLLKSIKSDLDHIFTKLRYSFKNPE